MLFSINRKLMSQLNIVYDECKARGQDPRIVSKLESMLLNSCCELIETSYQHIDFRKF
jgi:hypothetical protein